MPNLGKLALLGALLASVACYERRGHATKPPVDSTIEVKSCDGSTCADSGSHDHDHDHDHDALDETSFARRCQDMRPEANPDDVLCTSGTLEDFCATTAATEPACPRTRDEAIAYLCSLSPHTDHYFVFCNACGGENVMVPLGFGSFYFSFDAAENPVGATHVSDGPIGPCAQIKSVFGTSCAHMLEDGVPSAQPCPKRALP